MATTNEGDKAEGYRLLLTDIVAGRVLIENYKHAMAEVLLYLLERDMQGDTATLSGATAEHKHAFQFHFKDAEVFDSAGTPAWVRLPYVRCPGCGRELTREEIVGVLNDIV